MKSGGVLSLRVPLSTVLTIAVGIGLIWIVMRLWPQMSLGLLALLAAITLEPVVDRVQQGLGWSRGVTVGLMALLIVAGGLLVVVFMLPPLTEQLSLIVQDYARLKARVLSDVPADRGMMKSLLEQVMALPASPDVARFLKQPLGWAKVAVGGVAAFLWVVMLTFYLLVDGKRAYAWLLAFLPRERRDRAAETLPEASAVVAAYVRAQLVTSVLCALYALVVLSLLGVPAALPLAILAGVCDVLPIVGIVISTVPAMLLALTVSSTAAVMVVVLYLLYHLVENHLIIPRIYGSLLRLSPLAVLLAITVGGTLEGILGAVLILPFVALYPIVERIWLADYLNEDVIDDHQRLATALGEGQTRQQAVVDSVIAGEEHLPPSPPEVA